MAKQSSSQLGLHENTVEKQIEEANLLIERVMAALREIKIGITQYRTTNKTAASEDQHDSSVTELKAMLQDKCKSAQCPEECAVPDIPPQADQVPSEVDATPAELDNPPEPDDVLPQTEEPEEIPERVIKCGGCTPATCPVKQKASYQVPAEKPLVDLEAQEIPQLPEKDDTGTEDDAGAAKEDAGADDADDDGEVGDHEPADDTGAVNTAANKDCPCEDTQETASLIKTASCPSCKDDDGTQDKGDIISKVSFTVSVNSSMKKHRQPKPEEEDPGDAMLRKCVNCVQTATVEQSCVCADIVQELLAAEKGEQTDVEYGSPGAPPSILDKLRRLQVQTMPPVSIRGGLTVQKVIEMAIKPSGSTDVMYDTQGNVGYVAVNMEDQRDNISKNPVSFVALEVDSSIQMSFDVIRDRTINELKELRERMQSNPQTALDENSGDETGTKLHVLQSFQVLNSQDVGHVPDDDPLALVSILSGSIDVQVYKTFIDPNCEILGVGDYGDLTEDDVTFVRVRKTSLKTCGSTLIPTHKSKERNSARDEREQDHHAVQTKPIPEVEEDFDMDEEGSCSSLGETSMIDDITTQTSVKSYGSADAEESVKDNDQDKDESQESDEFAEPLPAIATLLPKECQEEDQPTNKIGNRTPFELGIYENKAIQCGSSHIPRPKRTNQGGTQMSDVSSSESTITSTSCDSQCSSSAGVGMTSRGIQVSFTEVSEEDDEADEGHAGNRQLAEEADVEYVSSEGEDETVATHTAASNEAVSEFLTGLTEKSANKIDVYSKSHGNLQPDDVSLSGADLETVSVDTLDLDENAQMLKNLVHDPSSKKLISKQSTIYKQIAGRSGESTTSQCCQVEFEKVDIWQQKKWDKDELLPTTTQNAAAADEDYERGHNQGEFCNIDAIPAVRKSPRLLSSDSHSRRYTLDISASEPTTLEDSLSEGEYRCKCSVSSGEIHICPFSKDMRTKVKYLRKHPRKFLKKDGREPKLDIVAQRSFYNNWLNYYESDNLASNDTSNNTEL